MFRCDTAAAEAIPWEVLRLCASCTGGSLPVLTLFQLLKLAFSREPMYIHTCAQYSACSTAAEPFPLHVSAGWVNPTNGCC